MVAVEQPRPDCGHLAALTQQCGKCLRWCCPECYAPWTALACGDCRAEARAAAANPYGVDVQSATIRVRNFVDPPTQGDSAASPGMAVERDVRCKERSNRARGAAGPHRHRDRTEVGKLAARVADLERRLQELGRNT